MQNVKNKTNEQKQIAIVPSIGHDFESMFIEKNTFFSSGEGRNPICIVREILETKGINLVDATKMQQLSKGNVVLFFGNIDVKLLSKFKDFINVYIAFEPPAVDITHEEKNLVYLKKYFDYILSWNDDLVDGDMFIKFNYCVDFFKYSPLTSFENKNLLTNISGKKQSKHPDELYSKRLEVINYFEEHSKQDFEFWGTGWDNREHKNYRGMSSSKADIYKNYRFAICFENQKNLNGYVTEKIWDCFICKVVPIYWGASNIEQYIPRGCYVNYCDFENIDSLITYLKGVTKEEYLNYIENIENFLNSNKIDEFKGAAFSDTIVGLLENKKKTQVNHIRIIFLELFKARMRIANSIQTHGYTGIIKKIFKK